ncbi:sulfotransferase 1 family member D1-like isoform X2 [Haematobia irritans]|uniref:sulfotransferase 1 family member D1-like isoform X2 n=1 Tax=Haematobia irritans TaxID=7368 RepID=UPI003F501747
MFTSHLRLSENISKRQKQRKFLNVTASGSNIPLTEIDWTERWCTLPMDGERYIKEVYEFEVKSNDVFLVTYPKCGTTWIQEASWLLMNNLDFETAQNIDLPYRSVFMELTALYESVPSNTVELARNAKEPRLLKTHLPAHLIPKQIWQHKNKIIYCARNPKDTAVSYFHFHKGLGTWEGTINEFIEDLINNDIMYTPFWHHVLDFWQMRDIENIFFTTYERMHKDLKKVLIDLNRFLEKPPLSEENLKKLTNHLSFANMKASPRTNQTFTIKAGLGSPHVASDFDHTFCLL